MHSQRELIIEELADPLVAGDVRTTKYPLDVPFRGALPVYEYRRLCGDSAMLACVRSARIAALAKHVSACGLDLAAVVDEFYAHHEIAAENSSYGAALPRSSMFEIARKSANGSVVSSRPCL